MRVDAIKQKLLEAMKDGRTVDKEILRVALGEIQTAEARSAKALSEDDVAAVLRKLVKSNRETLGATTDTAQRETLERELAVLESLLPKTLTPEEIAAALEPVADSIRGARSDGQATGVAMKHLKATGATAQGKDVAEAVRQLRS